ncbi:MULTISPECIES: HD-GYP domain-containing protein [unclassified Bradyrhizobium]
MLVHFVTDTTNKIPVIRAMLEQRHAVECYLLGCADVQALSDGVLVVEADLRKRASVEQLKAIFRNLQRISEKLFVIQNHLHHAAAQAFALGATAVLSQTSEILPKLAQVELEEKARESRSCDEPTNVVNGITSFPSLLSAIRAGKKISLSDAERATSEVISGIRRRGLHAWLDDVRRYHEGTFQHCLLVTGVAVAFALKIKFPDPDVERLGLAATLHDIGKAKIPLAILDKPGRLDPCEQDIMERHPVIGYELLKALPEIGPEVLDGVRHHHEYLDGSGYPDRLAGAQISDLVRLLTISDIFAALVERRPYRAPISNQEAYRILCDMDGKLEMALVRAFRDVALG